MPRANDKQTAEEDKTRHKLVREITEAKGRLAALGRRLRKRAPGTTGPGRSGHSKDRAFDQTEEALRENEEKYRTLFNSIDQGSYIIDVIFDESGTPVDLFFLEANVAATRMLGSDFTGKRLMEIDPSYEYEWFEIFGRVAETGQGVRMERYDASHDKWYSFQAFKLGSSASRRIGIIFLDITNQKHHAAHLAFLAEIAHDFSHLTSIDEIMRTIGEKVGTYFKAKTVNFCEVDAVTGKITAHYSWRIMDAPGRRNADHISQILTDEFCRTIRSGKTIVLRDMRTDPRVNLHLYTEFGVGSFMTVPFHVDGKWKAFLSITDDHPRDWREDEIVFFQELANLIFPRVDRARAEEALRRSEERYRTLFESIDEGFCIIQVIFDQDGEAVDYRFLEINPAFERHTGLKNAAGKTVLELIPDLEKKWIKNYGQVALTGKSKHFIDYSSMLNRWFEIDCFRIGEPQERKLAVLFNDITSRKETEETMRQLNATLEHRVAERTELADARAKQLQSLAVELIEAEERERKRVAHILHDDLQQILIAAKLQLQTFPAEESSKVDNISRLIKTAIDKSRSISHDLYPPALLCPGLLEPLKWLVLQMREQFGLQVELAGEESMSVSTSAKRFLYRAVQEFLLNIVKHADVKQAKIAIRKSEGNLIITVSDQGRGFDIAMLDPFSQKSGLGLAAIRERIKYMGGCLTIDSIPGQGSSFTLTIPLRIAETDSPL